MLVLIFLSLIAILLVPYLTYYAYMKNKLSKDWNLVVDKSYKPKISLIVATYNEAKVISKKLENIQELDYPPDKLQVIIVDSASTDGTLDICTNFSRGKNPVFSNFTLLSEKERRGKSHALNTALAHADGEIIATSDADSFWESDALSNAVQFFSDPSVGAVTGREEISNLNRTIHTRSEGVYRKFYYTLRLGESKVDSTFIFQGELSLYRKSVLKKFEDRPGYSDDIGTVVNIISQGYRCIFVPDAVFHDTAAYSLRGRLALKSRRAEHLISGILLAARLKLNSKFPLSSLIIFSNFYAHIICPLILLLTLSILLLYIGTLYLLLLFLLPILIFNKTRVLFVSYLTSNIVLILGIVNHFVGKKKVAWTKIEEMRHQ